MSIKQFPGGIITQNPTAPTTAAAKGIWTLDQASNYVKQGIWPRSPGTPTIGTATAGVASATVAYTAPADLGAGTVTFTATSSPGGLTGTGASPITVSGLTGGTSYTFTVTASTPGGTGPASAASNSVTPVAPPSVIGEAYGGGFYAGQIGVSSVATHYIIVGPIASAQTTNKWKNANTATSGADSDINGPQNTADMVADGNSTVYPCAHFCNDLSTGGQTDWYMPAKNELEVCYYNLKPTTTSNNTSSGINPNAVPARASNYTAGTPAQTSAAAFKDTGAEDFEADYYWSSTEDTALTVLPQNFDYGRQYFSFKDSSLRVRAIRRIAV
jgi:hypothetical protein